MPGTRAGGTTETALQCWYTGALSRQAGASRWRRSDGTMKGPLTDGGVCPPGEVALERVVVNQHTRRPRVLRRQRLVAKLAAACRQTKGNEEGWNERGVACKPGQGAAAWAPAGARVSRGQCTPRTEPKPAPASQPPTAHLSGSAPRSPSSRRGRSAAGSRRPGAAPPPGDKPCPPLPAAPRCRQRWPAAPCGRRVGEQEKRQSTCKVEEKRASRQGAPKTPAS